MAVLLGQHLPQERQAGRSERGPGGQTALWRSRTRSAEALRGGVPGPLGTAGRSEVTPPGSPGLRAAAGRSPLPVGSAVRELQLCPLPLWRPTMAVRVPEDSSGASRHCRKGNGAGI